MIHFHLKFIKWNQYKEISNKMEEKKLKFEDFKGIKLLACFEREIDDYREMPLFQLKGEDYTKENLKQQIKENCLEIFNGFHDNDNTFFRLLQDNGRWESWIPIHDIEIIFTLYEDPSFRRDIMTYYDFLEYEHQYQYHHSQKMSDIFEELIEKAWHPDRVFQWCV
jgi:hypothetical protein